MDKEELLRKYLDGDLDPEEEREALRAIAEDPDLHALFRFEHTLRSTFSEREIGDMEVPGGFFRGVMSRVEQLEKEHEEVPAWESVRNWFSRLWEPRPLLWRPGYAMILVLLFAVTFFVPYYLIPPGNRTSESPVPEDTGIQQVSESADQVWLRFVYINGDAENMAVAGDFSNWEPVPLTRQTLNGKQVWTGLVSMSRGEHRYMYIKNGEEWITDPLAPVTREDGFGNKNAVIYL